MSSPPAILSKLNLMLLEKKRVLENRIADLEWHGVYGPPLAIEGRELKLVNEILEIIK